MLFRRSLDEYARNLQMQFYRIKYSEASANKVSFGRCLFFLPFFSLAFSLHTAYSPSMFLFLYEIFFSIFLFCFLFICWINMGIKAHSANPDSVSIWKIWNEKKGADACIQCEENWKHRKNNSNNSQRI